MANENQKYLTAEQVSEYCGVSVTTVEKWINKGHMGVSKDKTRVDLENFIVFLKEKNNVYRLPKKTAGPKVLVIDGEAKAADSIGNIFSTFGFDVLTTHDPIKAGSLINYERPQIITLDLSLNVFDGLDVLKIINSLKLSEKIWIIVISAASEDHLQKAVDLGADCYLQKPFAENDLKKLINKFCPPVDAFYKAS